MIDLTPLVSNSASIKLSHNSASPKVENSRWAQGLGIVLLSTASFFEAQQTFITVFTDAVPKWHCTEFGSRTCNSDSNICKLPENSWSWDKPAREFTVSEWSLQCSYSPLLAIETLASSSFFLGCLLGGILLSILGGSLCRKKLLTLSFLIMSVASFFTAFSNNIWTYSGWRFVSGFCEAAIGSSVLVLSAEYVAKKWRAQVGSFGFFFSCLGFLSLPSTIAYLSTKSTYSWRALYLTTSIPAIFYCILLQFCFQSPLAHLLEQGNAGEALAVVSPNPKFGYGNRSVFQLLLLVSVVGFGLGIIYYTIPLVVSNMEFNLYLSVAFNASLGIPSLLMIFHLAKSKKRNSLLGLTLSSISSACGILCLSVGKLKGLNTGLKLITVFSAFAAFNLSLVCIAGSFPTSIKNSSASLSMVWQFVLSKGGLSPVAIAVAVAGYYVKILSYIGFGVVVLILGSMIIYLPETMGEPSFAGNSDEQEQEFEAQKFANGV